MGIDADNATNTNLTNSLIYNNTNDDGVYFYGGSHNLYLFNVNASNNGANGLLIKDTDNITIINSYTHENAGDGVDLQDSSEPVIILNLQSYSNADDGMYLESSNHVNITSSFFLNNTDDGVDQRYSNDTYYNGNVFLDNDDSGVAIINSTRVSFLNSTIESNLGSGFKGFELSNLTFANSTTIGNVIAGLHLIDNLEGNSFYNNVFNNTLNLNSSGNISFFNVSQSNEVNIISRVGFGGNYWSNYSSAGFSDGCTDANSDGICDSSFTIDGSNIDYFPLYMPVVSSTSSSGSLDTSGGGSGRCVNGWVKNSEGSGCIREADSTSLSSSENKGDDFGVSTLGSLEEGSSESSEDSHASGLAVDEELWAVKGLKDVYVFSGTLNAANLMWIIFGLLFMFILFIIIFGWREKKHKEEKKELKSLTKSHAKSRARQKAIWKKKKK
jgi:hypothetical protein